VLGGSWWLWEWIAQYRLAIDRNATIMQDIRTSMMIILRLATAMALAVATSSPRIANAQPRRDDIYYTRAMPNGCTVVKRLSAYQFVLEECSRSGVQIIKASRTKILGEGITLLTFSGIHSNYSGYYCSSFARGLPQGYSRTYFKCTSTGWQPQNQ